MKRLFKGLLGAVLSLSILTGAASALPTSEEPQQTVEESEVTAEQESDLTAADLVSGESMVFLPNGCALSPSSRGRISAPGKPLTLRLRRNSRRCSMRFPGMK